MPRIGGEATLWMNALYESVCILFLFPLIVVIGSSAGLAPKDRVDPVCGFLGRISYPLYLVHYPFVYMYFKYVHGGAATPAGCWGWGAAVVVFSILLAYACERFYDVPVRNRLRKKYL